MFDVEEGPTKRGEKEEHSRIGRRFRVESTTEEVSREELTVGWVLRRIRT